MLTSLIHFFYYTFMIIFPITNPVGMSPIFLSLTKDYDAKQRRKIAKRVAVNSFFIYLGALLFGSWILSFFALSIPIVKVAGGIMIFFAAFNMLSGKPIISTQDENEASADVDSHDISFFPLTMPITAGAGSLAMAITIGSDIIAVRSFGLYTITSFCGAAIGIAVLSLTIFICYYFADRIFAKLGKLGTQVVSQLAAFILLAISINIIWQGIRQLIS